MKGRLRLHLGIMVITLRITARKMLRAIGELLKRLGRLLVLWGEDNTPRFGIELFHACYLADVEFHIGMTVYRGPLYGAYASGANLFFKLNWVARKTPFGWKEEGGSCDFKLHGFGPPHRLGNGDVWFVFENGYTVLFLGKPRDRLAFMGTVETPRAYAHF